jgi:hypothetical protein
MHNAPCLNHEKFEPTSVATPDKFAHKNCRLRAGKKPHLTGNPAELSPFSKGRSANARDGERRSFIVDFSIAWRNDR